jgi:hypothetical protein
VVLLEKLDLNSSLDLSNYIVFNFYESFSLEVRKEIIQEITSRSNMLTKDLSNTKTEITLTKFSSNVNGKHSERLIIKMVELINDEEVIVKTSTRENIEKIMILNYRKATIVGTISNEDIEKHEFCWIKHLNKIFCYKKNRSKFIKEANFCLFSQTGNLIKSVFSTDNSIYEVNNLQVYLNVFNKKFFKRIILALNEEFNLIKIIDEDLNCLILIIR